MLLAIPGKDPPPMFLMTPTKLADESLLYRPPEGPGPFI